MWFSGHPEGTIKSTLYIYMFVLVEESVAIISERRRKSNLVIEQSKTFSIVLNCINESGELVTAGITKSYDDINVSPVYR